MHFWFYPFPSPSFSDSLCFCCSLSQILNPAPVPLFHLFYSLVVSPDSFFPSNIFEYSFILLLLLKLASHFYSCCCYSLFLLCCSVAPQSCCSSSFLLLQWLGVFTSSLILLHSDVHHIPAFFNLPTIPILHLVATCPYPAGPTLSGCHSILLFLFIFCPPFHWSFLLL